MSRPEDFFESINDRCRMYHLKGTTAQDTHELLNLCVPMPDGSDLLGDNIDPGSLIGKVVHVDGMPFTIVGVDH
jgi:hypothetical protein